MVDPRTKSVRLRAIQTITILATDPSVHETLGAALTSAGFRVVVADAPDAGIELAATTGASLVLVDGALGPPPADGGSAIRRIRLDPRLRDVACVLLTVPGEASSELRALDAGADAFIRKDEALDVIVARLAEVLGRRAVAGAVERPAPRILAVDDDDDYLEPLAWRIRDEGYVVAVADSGEDALARLATEPFDCILLALDVRYMGGLETCRRIKSAPMVRDTPLIMLTEDARDVTIDVLAAGADDVIAKARPFGVLWARLGAQIRRKHADDDNRRIREALLSAEIEAAEARAARELAETRTAMIDELGRKNQELEAFAYSVSHDLRAPLRAILGFCRALTEDCAPQLDDGGRRYLDRVVSSAQRMNELIEDLLGLSRIGRVDLHRGPIDLSALARAVAAELHGRDPDRQVEVRVDDGLVVHGDSKLIRIVLENLIGNAWKFTAKVAHARIEIASAASPHGPAVCIRDNGAGFDPAHAGQLFQPFRRLHLERDYEGTGIGLATVHRIVDRHGGRVWAEAVQGAGATFYFTLLPPRGRETLMPPAG